MPRIVQRSSVSRLKEYVDSVARTPDNRAQPVYSTTPGREGGFVSSVRIDLRAMGGPGQVMYATGHGLTATNAKEDAAANALPMLKSALESPAEAAVPPPRDRPKMLAEIEQCLLETEEHRAEMAQALAKLDYDVYKLRRLVAALKGDLELQHQ